MITLRKLAFRGFLSYRDHQILHLDQQGMVLVEGQNQDEGDSNRAGKSAIIEALLWGLYKKTIRPVRSDKIVNRFTHKGCVVDIEFLAGQTECRIRRYQKHPKHKNTVRLWIDGKERTSRHQEVTQQKIESLLGCDFAAFSNSVVFGGTRPFASLGDAEQKKILESFLHFEQIDEALKRTKEHLRDVEDRLSTQQQKQAELRGELSSLRMGLKSSQESQKNWQATNQQERDRLQARLEKLRSYEVTDYSKQIKKLEHRYSKAEAALNKTRSQYSVATDRWRQAQKEFQKHSAIQTDLPCPTCGQEVNSRTWRRLLKDLESKAAEAEQAARKLSREYKQAEEEASHAQLRLERVREKQERTISESRERHNRRKDLLGQLEMLTSAESPFAQQIYNLQVQRSFTLSRYLQVTTVLQQLQRQIRDLEFWIVGFGNRGLKAMFVRKALPAMNAKLAEYAQEIFGGTAELQFQPSKITKGGEERELFHLYYKSRFGADSYGGASAGERRRVDVCVLLVFAWMSRVCNCLLIDELLDGLDESGKEAVLRILGDLPGLILVMTHQRELKSRFGKVWTVTKHHGRSTITNA